jgi:hypothetical protein
MLEKQNLYEAILKKILISVKYDEIITAKTFLSKKFGNTPVEDAFNVWLTNWRVSIYKGGINDYIYESKEFLKCPVELVCELVRLDEIALNEIDIFERVLCWGRYQAGLDKNRNLSEILRKPLELIRFGRMDLDYLLNTVGGDELRDIVPSDLYLNVLESHITTQKTDDHVIINQIGPPHLYKRRPYATPPRGPKKSGFLSMSGSTPRSCLA